MLEQQYIIEPSWFYWINVIDTFHIMITVLLALSAIATGIFIIVRIYEGWYCEDEAKIYDEALSYNIYQDEDRKRILKERAHRKAQENIKANKSAKRWMIIGVSVVAGLGLILLFIPSKETLVAMQVAKFATWKNAEWTLETIKQAVDYIIEALGRVR